MEVVSDCAWEECSFQCSHGGQERQMDGVIKKMTSPVLPYDSVPVAHS